MRKIAVVTGTRAEYGVLHPVLRAIENERELQLSVVVTGMHLSHEFGYTVQEIEKDGFPIDARIDMLLSGDTSESMAKSVGVGIIGMAQAWQHSKPHVILVLGDRVEPLAATISGAYMNIPVAHISGGDVTRGGLDESARHAITKFAHIHFAATNRSAERIIKMGEDKWRVHVVGSLNLDVILNESSFSPEALTRRLALDLSQPLILVLQHPVSTQVDEASSQMRITMEAILKVGCPTVVLYPNSDAGGRRIIEVIKEYEKHPFIRTSKSLPRREYLNLMRIASVMVGNSSSGIVEAPSLGLPVVNIGIRQEGRERGQNVIDVGHDTVQVLNAIEKALSDREFLAKVKRCESPYGDGKTAPRIAEILSHIEISSHLLQKRMAY
jgi:UDP-N-acetylglucosamine 2-epimerase (non-hydrolysing)/GDP/UDP-N,N'-diacetylbacillosamine 2-epimerase (hydrolysing)